MAMFFFILLFGCLALPSQCRPRLQQIMDSTTTIVGSTQIDENKIYLNFCFTGSCDFFGGWKKCYCCKNFGPPKENCHENEEECRAKCIVCNPKCPSPPQQGYG
ncbi:hypothetical protein HU200_003277 [Digitaria exilis]|uniref:Embryo surrounding factor 1 brassicaceae domain-containing protein n=1 Tax=Digitaria exilis TaxID=1010633 RepID=A0A835KW01_9POAL|nr:hypothetical protein HU200_003277 [Digitaria exilis]